MPPSIRQAGRGSCRSRGEACATPPVDGVRSRVRTLTPEPARADDSARSEAPTTGASSAAAASVSAPGAGPLHLDRLPTHLLRTEARHKDPRAGRPSSRPRRPARHSVNSIQQDQARAAPCSRQFDLSSSFEPDHKSTEHYRSRSSQQGQKGAYSTVTVFARLRGWSTSRPRGAIEVGEQLQRDDRQQRLRIQSVRGRSAPRRRAPRRRVVALVATAITWRPARGPPACWRSPSRARASRSRRETTGVSSSSRAIGPCFISPAA